MIISATQERRTEPIMVMVLDYLHRPLTAKADLRIRIERISDRNYLDWSDNTFKPGASVVSMFQVLEEVSATYSPGWYRLNTLAHAHGFNIGLITNPIERDTYIVTAVQQPGTDAANLPQIGEIKVGNFVVEDRSPIIL